jgi:hypothetical protein
VIESREYTGWNGSTGTLNYTVEYTYTGADLTGKSLTLAAARGAYRRDVGSGYYAAIGELKTL